MMPTDRDLLARAAQAAGKSRAEWDYDWLVERGVDVSRDMLWNPLANSGEALELAAAKVECVKHTECPASNPKGYGPLVYVKCISAGYVLDTEPNCISYVHEEIGVSQPAAWRRAITRAAAATVAA